MAKDKKSFLLYCDLIHTVKQLPDDKAGELFKHILSYVNDENPITDDLVTNISFEPIKQQLKRDLKKYESICDRNSSNGKLGGRPKKQEEPKKPTGLIGLKNKPKKADSDTDTDKDILYTQIDFLNDWKKARLHYDKQITNITSLKAFELINFNKILKDYGSDDFYKAINGLFFQDTYKQTRLRPTHFLDNFETYLTCWQTKEKLFEVKKKETKL